MTIAKLTQFQLFAGAGLSSQPAVELAKVADTAPVYSRPKSRAWRYRAPAILALLLAVIASYAPALRDGFVWDDTALILRDPFIRSWRLIAEGWQHFLFTDATASDFYRPMQRLSYTLDYALAAGPFVYHLTSIFWHAAAAIALLFFVEDFLARFVDAPSTRRWLALGIALIWAVHPAQSAAVVYISGRADPMAAAFGFTGLFLLLRSQSARSSARWIFLAGAGAAFLLGALSKEMGLLFLPLGLVLVAARLQWKEIARWAVLSAFVVIAYASLRFAAEHIPAPHTHEATPGLVRPVLAGRALAEYAGVLLFPRTLRMERDVATHPHGFGDASLSDAAWRELQTLAGVLVLAGLIAWFVRARRQPGVRLTLVLFGVSYLPVSNLFDLNATAAEHWLYLPSAFLFLAIALSLQATIGAMELPRRMRYQRVLGAVFCAALIALGARTFVRTFDWKDQRTFFTRTIAANPGRSTRMLINLGGLELGEGHLAAARQDLESALQEEPGQPLAIINLASVAVQQKDFKRAHELLDRAVQMPLVEAQAHELRAMLENKETGQVNLRRLRLAARTGAPSWSIEKRYVRTLNETGNTEAAIAEVTACLKSEWYRAESWEMLAELLAKAGRPGEATQARATAQAYDVHLARRPPVL